MDKNYILSPETAEKKLRRMAFEILENNYGEEQIVLAGIRESGSVIARNIQRLLGGIVNLKTELITISLDKIHPRQVTLNRELDINDKIVIVIDDVGNS